MAQLPPKKSQSSCIFKQGFDKTEDLGGVRPFIHNFIIYVFLPFILARFYEILFDGEGGSPPPFNASIPIPPVMPPNLICRIARESMTYGRIVQIGRIKYFKWLR